MSKNTIENIDVNGVSLPVRVFGATVQELVSSYEIARDERNRRVILARALDGHIGQQHALRDEVTKNITYAHALESQMAVFEKAIMEEVNKWVMNEWGAQFAPTEATPEDVTAQVDPNNATDPQSS